LEEEYRNDKEKLEKLEMNEKGDRFDNNDIDVGAIGEENKKKLKKQKPQQKSKQKSQQKSQQRSEITSEERMKELIAAFIEDNQECISEVLISSLGHVVDFFSSCKGSSRRKPKSHTK